MHLSELLVVISLIALLAALLAPATVKAYRHAKAWIWGSYAWQENRIEAFLGENEALQAFYTTNEVKPWSFIERP